MEFLYKQLTVPFLKLLLWFVCCVYVDSFIHQHSETARLSGSQRTIIFDCSCQTWIFKAGNNFIELLLLAAEM